MTRPALVPELYVSDLALSLEFYLEALGFRIEYERLEERFAALSLGSAHLMLEQAPHFRRSTPVEFEQGRWVSEALEKPFGRGMNLEIEIDDIEVASERLVAKGYPLLLPTHERVYRIDSRTKTVRRLLVADPDGYLIRLSQVIP